MICDSQLNGRCRECVLENRSKIKVHACVSIDTSYFIGDVEARMHNVIIGNIPDAKDTKDPDMNWIQSTANAVLTNVHVCNVGKKN